MRKKKKASEAFKVAAFRKRCGVTQQQLADSIGVSVWQVSRWENGQHPGRMATLAMEHREADLIELGLLRKSKREK